MKFRYKLFVQFYVKTTTNMLQNVNNNTQQIQLNHTGHSVYTIIIVMASFKSLLECILFVKKID